MNSHELEFTSPDAENSQLIKDSKRKWGENEKTERFIYGFYMRHVTSPSSISNHNGFVKAIWESVTSFDVCEFSHFLLYNIGKFLFSVKVGKRKKAEVGQHLICPCRKVEHLVILFHNVLAIIMLSFSVRAFFGNF